MRFPMPRTYYGVNITPLPPGPAGLRWQAYINGRFKYADTLHGIKALVRREKGV